nr:MAG TPA: hypothetical protein [Caudoviricetes sp.]
MYKEAYLPVGYVSSVDRKEEKIWLKQNQV